LELSSFYSISILLGIYNSKSMYWYYHIIIRIHTVLLLWELLQS